MKKPSEKGRVEGFLLLAVTTLIILSSFYSLYYDLSFFEKKMNDKVYWTTFLNVFGDLFQVSFGGFLIFVELKKQLWGSFYARLVFQIMFCVFGFMNLFLVFYNVKALEYQNSLYYLVKGLIRNTVVDCVRFHLFCLYFFFSQNVFVYSLVIPNCLQAIKKRYIPLLPVVTWIFFILYFATFTPGGNSFLFEFQGRPTMIDKDREHSFKLKDWFSSLVSDINKLDEDIFNEFVDRDKFSKFLGDLDEVVRHARYQKALELCGGTGGRLNEQMGKVSDFGGYCMLMEDFEKSKGGIYIENKGMSAYLKQSPLVGKTIGDFGGGIGLYCQLMNTLGSNCEVFDGAVGIQERTKDDELPVKYLDLSRRAPVNEFCPIFDWVICTEVGEHVPKESEDVLLDNIALHAKEGVFLSWSVLGSIGPHHINCHSNNWVIGEMKKRGFSLDEEETSKARDLSLRYLKKTVLVFTRETQT